MEIVKKTVSKPIQENPEVLIFPSVGASITRLR